MKGWGYLSNATKWHYFLENGHSLCGKWLKLNLKDLEDSNDDSKDNCKTCQKRLKGLRHDRP